MQTANKKGTCVGLLFQRLRWCNHCTKFRPTLVRISKSRIDVYANDHHPPHFHIRANDGSKAAVAIRDLKVIAGEVPRAALSEALAWAEPRRPLLLKTWKELNS
ncbi:MAG: DUF4160 domain-containing protein [Rubrivivax sp.]|nr:MAG: DUF4160 domain-containing protein [Rubrivivax sp.]